MKKYELSKGFKIGGAIIIIVLLGFFLFGKISGAILISAKSIAYILIITVAAILGKLKRVE